MEIEGGTSRNRFTTAGTQFHHEIDTKIATCQAGVNQHLLLLPNTVHLDQWNVQHGMCDKTDSSPSPAITAMYDFVCNCHTLCKLVVLFFFKNHSLAHAFMVVAVCGVKRWV